MDGIKDLGEMFASVARLLQERETAMADKIAALEARVEELEAKLEGLQECAAGEAVENDVPEDAYVEMAGSETEVDGGEAAGTDADEWGEEPVEKEPEELVADEIYVEDAIAEETAVEMQVPDSQPEIEIEFEFEDQEPLPVVDKARPDWYDWEVDIPGPYIEDIRDGIGLNDRILFLNELFYGDEEEFARAVSVLNGMERLVDAVGYIRERFPNWDEESDEVYRFYMTVRRRFNKQKQEG